MAERTIVKTNALPEPTAALSVATVAGDFVYTSGQVGMNPAHGLPVDGFGAQVNQAILNLKVVLEAAGTDLAHVLKTTCFLADIGNFAEFDAIYGRHFGKPAPARSTIEAPLVNGWLFEIEAIAVAK